MRNVIAVAYFYTMGIIVCIPFLVGVLLLLPGILLCGLCLLLVLPCVLIADHKSCREKADKFSKYVDSKSPGPVEEREEVPRGGLTWDD